MKSRSVCLSISLGLAACAQYRSAPLDLERPLRAASTPTPMSWTYDEAVRYAVLHNPDLAALRARAAAVNLAPSREPAEASAGVDSDHRGELGVSLDALSLLGLGKRPFEVSLACARRDEALMAHHARAQEIAGEIAEVFVVERTILALAEPDYRVDVSAYVRAGLESGAAETAAAATAFSWEAERAARLAELRANHLVAARLLGLAPGAEFRLAPAAADWPAVTDPTPSALIAARRDVQRRVAAFETADREIRLAVRRQYPSLVLSPGVAMDPTTGFGAVRLQLPVGLSSEVHALESVREAARADVESSVLDAVREAGAAKARFVAAGATVVAARKRVESSAALLKGARLRLEVAAGSSIETVLSADVVVDAARGMREAAVDEARARVLAARSTGWPTPFSP